MILIAGTGAMACLFAARLSAAGQAVGMIGTWPAGLAALRVHGVRQVGEQGREEAYPVQVLEPGAPCRPAAFALVLVKSWQTDRAARQLQHCLAEDGLAISLQNGLGNREILAEVLGAERSSQGVTTAGASLLEPGRVLPAGNGKVMLEDRPGLQPLAGCLRAAGFQVETGADSASLIWGKLAINAAINPLTALLGVTNGELLNRPAARQLMEALATETATVAGRLGIHLPFADPLAAVEAVARDTAGNRSSMLQDLERGAPTEIDAICGQIVTAGRAAGVPTPVNETLWKLVKAAAQPSVNDAGTL